MKNLRWYLCLGLLISSGYALAVEAKKKSSRKDYSYFGVGYGPVSYTEKTPQAGGFKLEMGSVGQNMFVRSGGYVAVNDKIGFYLDSLNNSFANTQKESWDIQGLGTIQTNDTQIEVNEFNFYLANFFTKQQAWLFGISQNRAVFSRFTFRNGPKMEAYNEARNTPEIIQIYRDRSEVINALEDEEIYEQYIKRDATNLDGEGNPIHVEVTEKFLGISLLAGYQFTNFFDGHAGLSYFAKAVAGVPAYYYVENFSNSTTLDSYFDGYDINLAAGIGWETTMGIAYRLQYDMGHRFRSLISKINSVGQKVILPENELTFHRLGGSILWSF